MTQIRKLKGLALDRIENDPDMDFMDGVDDFDKLKSVFDSLLPMPKNHGTIIFFGTGGSLSKNNSFKDFYNDSAK